MAHISWLSPSAITTDLEDGDKEEIIAQLIELAKLTGHVTDASTLEHDIIHREELASTAIDTDIDAPHALSRGVSAFCMAIGVLEHRAIFVLIAWNESNTQNLKRLAVLLETLKLHKQKILAAQTSSEIFAVLNECISE